MKINERFLWALTILSPATNDEVLEIGCGTGILTQLIALQLNAGSITAIDRSESSINKAEKRNAGLIKEGKVKLIAGDFAKVTLPQHQFDKIVAFNVNIFWKGTDKDFQNIRQCLKPAGQSYIFYETPSWSDPKIERKIRMLLEANGFTISDIMDLRHPACICIIAAWPH